MVSAGEAAYRACRLRASPWSADDLRGKGRWLFLTPHPDDETLGCGGLLHALAAAGERPLVVYLTDGAASHRGSRAWPPSRLAAIRRFEAIAALRVLGVPRADIFWMDWPDANPHLRSSRAFASSRARLAGLCRSARIRAMACTWRAEPHCDHVAAFELAQAVTGRSVALYEYLVWGWTLADLPRSLARCKLHRFDVRRSRALRKRALACHRTQTSAMINDTAQAFRLPPQMAALAGRETEILIRAPRRWHAA